MQIILGAIASCFVVVVTAYFGVRGDVRERAALKDLIELRGALDPGHAKDALNAEIERRVKAIAPSSAERAEKTRKTQFRTILGLLVGGVFFYGGSLWVTGLTETVPSWVVALVFVALPLGSLMLCAGAISGLRYRRRYF